MTTSTGATSLRRARIAVSALFFTNGALTANLLPRYPEIKDRLALDPAAYGVAVASFPAGAIIAGLAAGVLIRRFGSGRMAVAGTLCMSLAVLAAGIAPSVWWFAGFLLVGGALDAITDVAQNAHGLRVQRHVGSSIINSFHAVWSIGAVTGGAMAAVAIALHAPVGVHLGVSAVLFALVSLAALRWCLPGADAPADAVELASGDPDDDHPQGTGLATGDGGHESADAVTPPSGDPDDGRRDHRAGDRPAARGPGRAVVMTLAALVLIAVAGSVVEDAGNSWATLYLGTLGAQPALAATGFIALVGAQFVGRVLGDGFVNRFGRRAVARAGGVIVAVGMGLALAFPSVPGTILGFAAAGFGVATLVPAAMHAADDLPGLRHGTGLTIVSWLMRLGFLLSPPLVGLIADHAGLRAGLLIVPVVGIAVVALSGVLDGRRPA